MYDCFLFVPLLRIAGFVITQVKTGLRVCFSRRRHLLHSIISSHTYAASGPITCTRPKSCVFVSLCFYLCSRKEQISRGPKRRCCRTAHAHAHDLLDGLLSVGSCAIIPTPQHHVLHLFDSCCSGDHGIFVKNTNNIICTYCTYARYDPCPQPPRLQPSPPPPPTEGARCNYSRICCVDTH